MRKIILLLLIITTVNILFAQVNRSIDGAGNNLANPSWGAIETPFKWYSTVSYSDGMNTPAGNTRPNARAVSNIVSTQSQFEDNELGLSDFVWAWGQFIDHDIVLTESTSPPEQFNIPVPSCDAFFDPNCTGSMVLHFNRAAFDTNTGSNTNNPRTHINKTTAFLDASMVYGSAFFRAAWMRTYTDGKMKTSLNDLLPYNTLTGKLGALVDPNAPPMVLEGNIPTKYFISGDIRANEQPTLTALHIIFLREHNRLCDVLKAENPTWSDEELYQRARKWVGAFLQSITYEEFLPTIGVPIDAYTGYDATVDPTIMNVFSTAAFRFGHSAVSGRLTRYDKFDDTLSFGNVDLRTAFTNPLFIENEDGVEPFLRGLAAQKHQKIDAKIVDDLRNFLFGAPGSGGLDLAALNIQRGRDKGLADYNTIRQNFGLSRVNAYNEINSDQLTQVQLQTTYNSVDDIDAWVGLLSEEHLPNAILGETMTTILQHQFEALRDGDRFYYENDPTFSTTDINEIKNTTLADLIKRNSTITSLQPNVFIAKPRNLVSVEVIPFRQLRQIHLTAYPNPIQQYFNLRVQAVKTGKGTLQIIDASGKIVKTQNLQLVRGENTFEFELDDILANGLYTILLTLDGDRGQLKVLKVQ